MKKLLCGSGVMAIALMMSAGVAKADDITITFDAASQSVTAGGTIEYFGTITNDTSSTIYLNNDDLNLAEPSLTTTDQFFNTVPFSLDAGETSADIELFDVSASDPLTDAAGTFMGTYTLFGGADGDAQDNLGSQSFSVTTEAATSPVPEPGSIVLVLSGLSAAWVPVSRRLR